MAESWIVLNGSFQWCILKVLMFSMWFFSFSAQTSIMFGANKFFRCNFSKEGTKLSTTSLFHIFSEIDP